MITLSKCKNGFLYFISARNSRLGIFDEKQKGFIICREKFGDVFLFTEYHWDMGAPNGTAMPFKKLEKVPLMNDDDRLVYLAKRADELTDKIGLWDKTYMKEAQEIVRADFLYQKNLNKPK